MNSEFNPEETARFQEDLVGENPGLSNEEQASIEALPEGNALLIVTRGPNLGARFYWMPM